MPPLRHPLRQGRVPERVPRRGCPFSYSHEEFGHTYMGCLMKVFDVEIDVDLEAESGAAASDRQGDRARCNVQVAVEACYRRGRASSAASIPSSTSCRSASLRSDLAQIVS
jgi:hypothetical protein